VFWQKGNFALLFAVNREVKHDALEQKHLKKTFELNVLWRDGIRKTLLTTHFQK